MKFQGPCGNGFFPAWIIVSMPFDLTLFVRGNSFLPIFSSVNDAELEWSSLLLPHTTPYRPMTMKIAPIMLRFFQLTSILDNNLT